MWTVLTMSELYDLMNQEKSSVFSKPTFPTRRWGQIHTKMSTTDVTAIDKGIQKLREQGHIARKRLCKESMLRWPRQGKFYKIEKKEI